MKKNRIWILLAVLLCFCVSCGNNNSADQEDELVIADNEEDTSVYSLVAVTKDTVTLTQRVTCDYVQSTQQDVKLESGGRLIERVCVHEGDQVKKGDVLIKLAGDNLEQRIENLSYQIKTNELKLQNLDTHKEFSIRDNYYNHVYGNPGLAKEEDLEKYQKTVDGIEREYRYQREDLEDAIEFDKKELAQLEHEYEESRVLATIDGMVYKIEKDLEGATTRKDQVIMTIVDESDGYFVTEDWVIAENCTADMVLSMHVTSGESAGDYEIVPTRMDEWGEQQYFSVLAAPENSVLVVGAAGTITLVVEEKQAVLSLPNGCIHVAGDDRYVYVLDDTGMKTVRYVKTGLAGNDYTEILEGLSEGDMVVKK